MSEMLKLLTQIEQRLPNLVFSQEKSLLNDLNNNFSPFRKKDFLSWLNDFLKEKNHLKF